MQDMFANSLCLVMQDPVFLTEQVIHRLGHIVTAASYYVG